MEKIALLAEVVGWTRKAWAAPAVVLLLVLGACRRNEPEDRTIPIPARATASALAAAHPPEVVSAPTSSVPAPSEPPGGAEERARAVNALEDGADAARKPEPLTGAPRGGCGYVEVGGERVPLDCYRPDYGQVEGIDVAAPIGASKGPSRADHRRDGTE